jgi:FMN-dependent NADH-azoreductase
MKVLHIDAGITGAGSVSRQLSAAVIEALVGADPTVEIVRRDLDADPISHLGSHNLATLGATEATSAEAAESARALAEFLEADVVVIGAPMYNFSIPTQLKAWFDRVVVAGKTFRYTAEGPLGLAGGKRVIIASARGGLYAPGSPSEANDFHEPYLRALLRMMGIEDVTVVRAEGVAVSPEQREAAIEAGLGAAPEAAAFALPLAA